MLEKKDVIVVTDSWGDFHEEFEDYFAALAFYNKLVEEYAGKREIYMHRVIVRPMGTYKPIEGL